jgi:hypothetical protein
VLGGAPSRYGVDIYTLCEVRAQSQCEFIRVSMDTFGVRKMSFCCEKDTSTLYSVAYLHMSRAHALALRLLIVYIPGHKLVGMQNIFQYQERTSTYAALNDEQDPQLARSSYPTTLLILVSVCISSC